MWTCDSLIVGMSSRPKILLRKLDQKDLFKLSSILEQLSKSRFLIICLHLGCQCVSHLLKKSFLFSFIPFVAALMESFERYLRSRWYYYSATGIGTYIYTSTGKTDLIEEERWLNFICVCVCLPRSSSWSVLYLHDMTSSSLFSQSVMLSSGRAYEGRPRRCPGNG